MSIVLRVRTGGWAGSRDPQDTILSPTRPAHPETTAAQSQPSNSFSSLHVDNCQHSPEAAGPHPAAALVCCAGAGAGRRGHGRPGRRLDPEGPPAQAGQGRRRRGRLRQGAAGLPAPGVPPESAGSVLRECVLGGADSPGVDVQPIVHVGFIPLIIALGMTCTEPRPTLAQLLGPM